MNLLQIYAVLGLLLAFHVPQSEVNNVRTILLASVSTPMEQSQPVPQTTQVSPPEVFGSITPQTEVQPTCDNTITASATPADGGSWDFGGVYNSTCPIPADIETSASFSLSPNPAPPSNPNHYLIWAGPMNQNPYMWKVSGNATTFYENLSNLRFAVDTELTYTLTVGDISTSTTVLIPKS